MCLIASGFHESISEVSWMSMLCYPMLCNILVPDHYGVTQHAQHSVALVVQYVGEMHVNICARYMHDISTVWHTRHGMP